jgi:hypothetical protein
MEARLRTNTHTKLRITRNVDRVGQALATTRWENAAGAAGTACAYEIGGGQK